MLDSIFHILWNVISHLQQSTLNLTVINAAVNHGQITMSFAHRHSPQGVVLQ